MTAALGAAADGMIVRNGRYAGGAATTLVLDKGQLGGWPQERWLRLTEAQKAQLRAETGIAPSKLVLYDARVGETDCTCHAWNVGFLFTADGIDVPHEFLVTDEEAARRADEWDESD